MKKKYSLKQDDRENSQLPLTEVELNEQKYNNPYTAEMFVEEPKEEQPVPKWKEEQEIKKRKKNIRSAHPTGTVQGGEAFPPGLNLDEFLKLQKLSKLRNLYYTAIVMLYVDSVFEVMLSLFRSAPIQSFVVLLVFVGCTLLVQFKNSTNAALVMLVVSLFYSVIMSCAASSLYGLDMVIVSVMTLISVRFVNRLYINYLSTLTVPDKLTDVFKV